VPAADSSTNPYPVTGGRRGDTPALRVVPGVTGAAIVNTPTDAQLRDPGPLTGRAAPAGHRHVVRAEPPSPIRAQAASLA
jgi:hypothetical protein